VIINVSDKYTQQINEECVKLFGKPTLNVDSDMEWNLPDVLIKKYSTTEYFGPSDKNCDDINYIYYMSPICMGHYIRTININISKIDKNAPQRGGGL